MAAPTVVSTVLLDNGNWEIHFSDNTYCQVPAVIPTDFSATPPAANFGSGSGGGGGAVTIASGADVVEGSTTDTSSSNTVFGVLKAIKAAVQGTLAVSGTFWQATQPVSVADGSQVTLGAKADTPSTGLFGAGAASVVNVLKAIANRFIGTPNWTTSQVSVTTTSVTLLAANTTRAQVVIINSDATNPIYISSVTPATTANSIKLTAGQSITLRNVNNIYAIATGATVTAMVSEESY